MLDSCMRPELVTEITLQPVRRRRRGRGDLLQRHRRPAQGHRHRPRHQAGRRPGRRAPDPHPRRPRPAARPHPRGRPLRHRGHRSADRRTRRHPLIGFAGAPFTLASYLVEGGPSRTYENAKAMMYGDPELWADLLDRLAEITSAFLKVQIEAGCQRRPALRLLGKRARPDRLPPLGAARLREGLPRGRGVRRPAHPLRSGHRRAAPADGRGRGGRRRRRLARPARRGRPPGRPRQGAPGQPRPDRPVRSTPRPSRPRPARSSSRPCGLEGHVFNLGHGVMPSTDPDALTRLVEYVHTQTAR